MMEDTLKYPEKFKIVILNKKMKICFVNLRSCGMLHGADW
jgi:hypothetical protein